MRPDSGLLLIQVEGKRKRKRTTTQDRTDLASSIADQIEEAAQVLRKRACSEVRRTCEETQAREKKAMQEVRKLMTGPSVLGQQAKLLMVLVPVQCETMAMPSLCD